MYIMTLQQNPLRKNPNFGLLMDHLESLDPADIIEKCEHITFFQMVQVYDKSKLKRKDVRSDNDKIVIKLFEDAVPIHNKSLKSSRSKSKSSKAGGTRRRNKRSNTHKRKNTHKRV